MIRSPIIWSYDGASFSKSNIKAETYGNESISPLVQPLRRRQNMKRTLLTWLVLVIGLSHSSALPHPGKLIHWLIWILDWWALVVGQVQSSPERRRWNLFPRYRIVLNHPKEVDADISLNWNRWNRCIVPWMGCLASRSLWNWGKEFIARMPSMPAIVLNRLSG